MAGLPYSESGGNGGRKSICESRTHFLRIANPVCKFWPVRRSEKRSAVDDALGRGPLLRPRRSPGRGLRVGTFPGGDVSVVGLVGRDEVPNRAQGVNLRKQPVVGFGRGSQEQVAAVEAHDDHAGREGYRAASEVGHPEDRPVDHPKALADRLEHVEGLVELHVQRINRAPRLPAAEETHTGNLPAFVLITNPGARDPSPQKLPRTPPRR